MEFKYPQQETETQNASILTAIIQFCYLIDVIDCLCFNIPSMESKQPNFRCQNQQRCAEESILPRWQHAADIWPSRKQIPKNGHRKTWGRNWVQVGCCREKHPNLFKLIPIVFKDHPSVNWYIHGSESVYQSDHNLGLEKKYSCIACTPFHGPT